MKNLLLLLLLAFSSVSAIYPSSNVLPNTQAHNSGVKGICNGDPVAYIIRQHPELLIHKRDEVLRHGMKKSTQYSLQGCINCHAQRNTNDVGYHAINTSGQFCAICHEQVAVSVDCFECHRTTPYSGKRYYTRVVNE